MVPREEDLETRRGHFFGAGKQKMQHDSKGML